MALGNFSPSVMPGIFAALKETATDNRVMQRQRLMPPSEILQVIKNQEQGKLESVRPNDRKCEEFKVTWLEESDNKATVHTNVAVQHLPPCVIDGEELQSNNKTYKVKNDVQFAVKVKDEDCGNMFDAESKLALALLQGEKKIIKGLAEALPGMIYAYAGINQADGIAFDGNIGENDPNNPFVGIDADDLKADKIIPYLTMVSTFNKLQNPILLDGGLLLRDFWEARMKKQGGGDGVPNEYWDLMEYNQDIINMNDAGFLNWAFLIDAGNLQLPIISFAPELGNDNELVADKFWFTKNLSGITLGGRPVPIDVTYTKKEEAFGASGTCQLVHTFDMKLKWDLWQAPRYTTDPVTGIIALKRNATV